MGSLGSTPPPIPRHVLSEQTSPGTAEIPRSRKSVSLYRNGRKICLGGTWNNRAVDATNSRKTVGTITLPGGDRGIGTPQVFVR